MSYSSAALAKRLGLSKQYLSRAEQGTYSNINPALTKWVSEALQISSKAVHHRYVQFQQATRISTIERIAPDKLERIAEGDEKKPGHELFERWRNDYWTSPMQFAVAFCVHPDSVQKYEEGIQKQMPGQIRLALLEAKLIDESWVDAP